MKAFLCAYWREKRGAFAVFIAVSAIFIACLALYRIPPEAALYPALLSAGVLALLLAFDVRRAWRTHRSFLRLEKLPPEQIDVLPKPRTVAQADCQRLVEKLCCEQRELSAKTAAQYADILDYYTLWAHQIKTPIASMRLTLQAGEHESSDALTHDLQRIEQYVQMALVFLRLDSGTTDLVIQRCDLDGIIRPVIHKLASQFIHRKLSLDYEPLSETVLTDEKWLSFVVEQVLTNALKYTPHGGVRIFLEQPKTLCIRDTGIGIAPEDLPRVFDKGYTGLNGRLDKKASGIGLYLCRRICIRLGHTIQIESRLGQGTTVRIDLSVREIQAE